MKTRYKKQTMEELIALLPLTTYNCESFGLCICVVVTNEGRMWECKYYSHFSNKNNDVFPDCQSKSPRIAVKKMLRAMGKGDVIAPAKRKEGGKKYLFVKAD